MAYVRLACERDAWSLALRLRSIDISECRAGGKDPLSALLFGVRTSTPAASIVGDDGQVIGMCGVSPSPDLPGAGAAWLLASEELFTRTYARQFLRECRHWCDLMNRRYPLLFNVIDASNHKALRWLRWCGFETVNQLENYGGTGRPYLTFQRVRHV